MIAHPGTRNSILDDLLVLIKAMSAEMLHMIMAMADPDGMIVALILG